MDYEKDFDMWEAGAGVAGVAAALESARGGLRTGLVQKTMTGQVSGIAARLAVQHNTIPDRLGVRHVQRERSI